MSAASLPKYIRQILFTLQGRGYSACLLGVCVRELLMDKRPHGWELCASAQPEELRELFPLSRPAARAGAVTVTLGSHEIDIACLRAPGGQPCPDRVAFVGALTEELGARDFTVNAVALSADGLIADPFGGVEDIRAGLIRCVGDAGRRFTAEPLAMLRALRLAAKLGFTLEIGTLLAMQERAALAATLPAAEVRDELEKLLLTDAPETVYPLMELGLLDAFLRDRPLAHPGWRRLRRLPRKALPRWAGFAVLLERLGAIPSAEGFLQALALDSRSLRLCAGVNELLREPLPTTSLGWKKALRRYESAGVSCAAAVSDALYGGQSRKALRAVLRSGECFSLKHLAVTGDDLLALGLRGRAVGEMLQFLLEYVMEYPENNRRELLLSLAGGGSEE